MKALLSVYDKNGIVDFAKELVSLGWEILASGGTAKALTEAGIKVQDVASLVGGGAILGHRVVTLSRELHAGLLATDSPQDTEELKKLNIPRIDLVCVDLYPLKEEISRPGATRESVIEKTDVGGPTMIRSGAKGRRIVICDSKDRMKVIEWLKANKPDTENFINNLVAKSEAVIADYCLTSAKYHSQDAYSGVIGEQAIICKYGENAWQAPAMLFKTQTADPLALAHGNFKRIAGDTLSYNNLCDLDRLLQTATHIAASFDINWNKVPFIAVGVKHGNPCGAAVGSDAKTVLQNMLEGDLRAIFGGLVLTNFAIDETLAETILSHKMDTGRRLLDGIIAPSFTPEAVEMLKRKGDKCRFLANSALSTLNKDTMDSDVRLRYVRGGFLKQPNYTFILDMKSSDITKVGVSPSQEQDMLLAWAIGSTSNSNTVTIVKDGKLLGNGVGQQDRVGCCELALKRAKDAGHDTKGAVAYSDSFFPFTDGPAVLINAGIAGILATSGSVRDDEVKKLCAEKGTALAMIPDKLARGFFGH